MINSGFIRFLAVICGIMFVLSGCVRSPSPPPESSMRPARPPVLSDDLGLASLAEPLKAQIEFHRARGLPAEFRFGSRRISRADYISGLERFLEILRSTPGEAEALQTIRAEFEFLEVYGARSWGDVFVTSYFEPVIEGARKESPRFPQPLYRRPEDLVLLDLERFSEKYRDDRKLRGRLVGGALLPYYSREEIDSKGALTGRGLEICWVDPFDAFFMQIQGSGTVVLEDGSELRLNYAEKNGQPYEAIGRFLKEVIAPEKLNLQGIEEYLRSLPMQEAQAILNRNPSYVFFEIGKQNALTASGIPAAAGRTIATDRRYFPKGTLAFLSFERPDAAQTVSAGQVPEVARFVLDQDVGGAITGPGRVDLFWGKGAEARQMAGMMRGRGRLYYLLPRKGS